MTDTLTVQGRAPRTRPGKNPAAPKIVRSTGSAR